MSLYIIGDVHGCLSSLKRLIDKLRYDPAHDELWFVGDLINRGPESLHTLRYIKTLGPNAKVVLGNHDLHCLAVYYGVRKHTSKDTLKFLVAAHDAAPLIDWLRTQPFLMHHKATNTVMVHAGIPPMWDLKTAKKQSKKLRKSLSVENPKSILSTLFSPAPSHWRDADTPRRRRKFSAQALTRMRYCWADGSMDFTFNRQPAARPTGLEPWYRVPNRVPIDATIVFGHWAAHPAMAPPGIVPIDRGCVYGGCLVAYLPEEGRCVWVKAVNA